MESRDTHDMPGEQDTERGYANDNPSGSLSRILRAMSLLMVLTLILAASSVIIYNTENGLAVVLVVVAIVAIVTVLLLAWGSRSRTGEPEADL